MGISQSGLLGQPSRAMRFMVSAQQSTTSTAVELLQMVELGQNESDSRTERAILHFAIGGRPGEPTCHFPEVPGHKERAIGDIIYVPAHMRLRSSWTAVPQWSICLMIDAQSARLDREWTPELLDAALNLKVPCLRDRMICLVKELEHPRSDSAAMVEVLCAEINILLRRHFEALDEGAEALGGGRFRSEQIRAAIAQLDTGGPPPKMADLARKLGISPRHFSRIFQCATGQNYSEYVAALRIEYAKRLLADGNTAIKQVAWRSGFQTSAAFSAAFRRATGVSPTAYRTEGSLKLFGDGTKAI